MELVRHKKFYSVLNLNLNKDKIVKKLNFISTSFSKQKKIQIVVYPTNDTVSRNENERLSQTEEEW